MIIVILIIVDNVTLMENKNFIESKAQGTLLDHFQGYSEFSK